jgi:hypothetical protein
MIPKVRGIVNQVAGRLKFDIKRIEQAEKPWYTGCNTDPKGFENP